MIAWSNVAIAYVAPMNEQRMLIGRWAEDLRYALWAPSNRARLCKMQRQRGRSHRGRLFLRCVFAADGLWPCWHAGKPGTELGDGYAIAKGAWRSPRVDGDHEQRCALSGDGDEAEGGRWAVVGRAGLGGRRAWEGLEIAEKRKGKEGRGERGT